MTYDQKVLLFHCLEWLCFWWENQTECNWEGCTQDAEGAEEFAAHWWSCEQDAYEDADKCWTVNYSAGVFCEDITEVEISERFADKLDEMIEYDKEFFMKVSGQSYEDFMPSWW